MNQTFKKSKCFAKNTPCNRHRRILLQRCLFQTSAASNSTQKAAYSNSIAADALHFVSAITKQVTFSFAYAFLGKLLFAALSAAFLAKLKSASTFLSVLIQILFVADETT